ncbi:hypothetical protein RSOLAG22IIIB_04676 [Rhizoctonia solani]|uniref:Uncharacterized protein n=1 Tax=Rhizoctonia solani TaxID=456999 RepID=A0A0K6FZY9_9AGAM|nr:hypothetical protein RSOLAG22IIIB_04676 [Rhizoctonia solani]
MNAFNGHSGIIPPASAVPPQEMSLGTEEIGMAAAATAIYLLGGPPELAIATGMATAISALARVALIISPITPPTSIPFRSGVEDNNEGVLLEDKEEAGAK